MFRLSSVRLRGAICAALAAGVMFGLGAWWLRAQIYEQHLATAEDGIQHRLHQTLSALPTPVATSPAPTVVGGEKATNPGPPPAWVWPDAPQWTRAPSEPHTIFSGETYVYIGPGGRAWSDDLDPFMPGGLSMEWAERQMVTIPAPREGTRSPLAGQTLRAICRGVPTTDGKAQLFLTHPEKIAMSGGMLCIFVMPWQAKYAVAAVDRLLVPAIPVGLLLITAIGWFVTGRSLQPVEAIRGKLATIGASALNERVPVPRGDDEIGRLARTTNETLDRLESAALRQRRFIADASHELRSPLASLRVGIDVAKAHPETADLATLLDDTSADLARMQALVEDLLTLSRLDDPAALPAEPAEPVELAALVAEQAAGRDGFTVHADGPAVVAGDPRYLNLLLRNLFDNASRHAATGVVVNVTTLAEQVRLDVHDDGPGIPEAEAKRIFEPFTRLDEARDRDTGVVGLGLAIARDIVRRHSGVIFVDQTRQPGACLTVLLPALALSNVQRITAASSDSPPGPSPAGLLSRSSATRPVIDQRKFLRLTEEAFP